MPTAQDITIYEPLEAHLPLYGGRPGDELAALLASEGFEQTHILPLMDAALWVETPKRPRFMVTGRRPLSQTSG